VSYDLELDALHELIQNKVVSLLTNTNNIVKRTLMKNGLTRLCVFFGRQKANDVLLSHIITFLNDKHDWQIRGDFFESIVGIAVYIGCQSLTILKPLLQTVCYRMLVSFRGNFYRRPEIELPHYFILIFFIDYMIYNRCHIFEDTKHFY